MVVGWGEDDRLLQLHQLYLRAATCATESGRVASNAILLSSQLIVIV